MGNKIIHHSQLTDSLRLTECTDGFWLYDDIRGMNLAWKAQTSQAAFVEALGYYQRRLSSIEKSYFDMKAKVDNFVEFFTEFEQ